MSALIQFRIMSGTIEFAIMTVNFYIKARLINQMSSIQIESLLRIAEAFKKPFLNVTIFVKIIFAQSYNMQMRIMVGFSAAQIPITLLLWRREQISISPRAD